MMPRSFNLMLNRSHHFRRDLRSGSRALLWVLVLLASSWVTSICRAGNVTPPYQIGTWEGFRPGAVSFTFDDDLPNQYSVAVPMFNARGLKLTLFTVTSWLPGGSWGPIVVAAAAGHEIASHTLTHPDLSSLDAVTVTNEMKLSQYYINASVTNQRCLTLAYPYCNQPANLAAVSNLYIAARGCSGQFISANPSSFMNLSSFVCGSSGLLSFLDMKSKVDGAWSGRSWCVFLIHAIDNDNGYSPLPSTNLQAVVDYCATNSSKVWVDTFGHVVCYIQERNAASVIETAATDTSLTLQVTNALAPSIYTVPITIRRPLPAGWPGAAVSQNNQALPTQFVNITSTNYVMFDVVPNTGDITLTKVVVPVVLSNPRLSSPSTLALRLDGQPGARYAIQSSTDLSTWISQQTNTLAGSSTNLSLSSSTDRRFYRARWLP